MESDLTREDVIKIVSDNFKEEFPDATEEDVANFIETEDFRKELDRILEEARKSVQCIGDCSLVGARSSSSRKKKKKKKHDDDSEKKKSSKIKPREKQEKAKDVQQPNKERKDEAKKTDKQIPKHSILNGASQPKDGNTSKKTNIKNGGASNPPQRFLIDLSTLTQKNMEEAIPKSKSHSSCSADVIPKAKKNLLAEPQKNSNKLASSKKKIKVFNTSSSSSDTTSTTSLVPPAVKKDQAKALKLKEPDVSKHISLKDKGKPDKRRKASINDGSNEDISNLSKKKPRLPEDTEVESNGPSMNFSKKPEEDWTLLKTMYNKSSSKVRKLSDWNPFVHPHLTQCVRERNKLKDCSVIICDLKQMTSVFHQPGKASISPTIEFRNHMGISNNARNIIRQADDIKRSKFAAKLNQYLKQRANKRSTCNVANKPGYAAERSKLEKHELQNHSVNEQELIPKSPLKHNKVIPKKTAKNRESTKTEALKRKIIDRRPKSLQKLLREADEALQREEQKPKIELKIPRISKNTTVCNNQEPHEELQCDIRDEVFSLLNNDIYVDIPVVPKNPNALGIYTIKKLAWWLLKCEDDPPEKRLYHPEIEDQRIVEELAEAEAERRRRREEGDELFGDSDTSSLSIGCVSDPEGKEMKKCPKEIDIDEDKADEYCGCAELGYSLRKPGTSLQENQYIKLYAHKPGSNYDKSTFSVKCLICQDILRTKRQLGAHVRGESHKTALKNLSLEIATYEEYSAPEQKTKIFKAKLARHDLKGRIIKDSTEKYPEQNSLKNTGIQSVMNPCNGNASALSCSLNDVDASGNAGTGVVSMDANNPDGFDQPLGSPAAIIGLEDELEDEVELDLPQVRDYEDSDLGVLKEESAIKAVLVGKKLWTDKLHEAWAKFENEINELKCNYDADREHYVENPEKHIDYQKEWENFWLRRCEEVENLGEDPKSFDFISEWAVTWPLRMKEIMLEDAKIKAEKIKKKHGFDLKAMKKLQRDVDNTYKRGHQVHENNVQQSSCPSQAIPQSEPNSQRSFSPTWGVPETPQENCDFSRSSDLTYSNHNGKSGIDFVSMNRPKDHKTYPNQRGHCNGGTDSHPMSNIRQTTFDKNMDKHKCHQREERRKNKHLVRNPCSESGQRNLPQPHNGDEFLFELPRKINVDQSWNSHLPKLQTNSADVPKSESHHKADSRFSNDNGAIHTDNVRTEQVASLKSSEAYHDTPKTLKMTEKKTSFTLKAPAPPKELDWLQIEEQHSSKITCDKQTKSSSLSNSDTSNQESWRKSRKHSRSRTKHRSGSVSEESSTFTSATRRRHRKNHKHHSPSRSRSFHKD